MKTYVSPPQQRNLITKPGNKDVFRMISKISVSVQVNQAQKSWKLPTSIKISLSKFNTINYELLFHYTTRIPLHNVDMFVPNSISKLQK